MRGGERRGEDGGGLFRAGRLARFPFCDEAGSCLMVPSFSSRPRELAVRLGCKPCAEEQAFLSRRKQVVAKALKQALQLDGDLQEDEVWGQSWTGWGSSGPVLDAGTGCALTRPELVPRQAWTLLYFPLTGLLSGAWSHQMQGTAKGTRH